MHAFQRPAFTLTVSIVVVVFVANINTKIAAGQDSGVNTLGDASSPNVIVMMADDMGMGDTSAYQDITGNGDTVQVHTPNMERLARLGVRMTDAHTPSSRCSPTRYALMTGRYPWRNRLKYWVLFGSQGDPMIEDDRPTIASLLRNSGYRTAMVGKWHVGLRYRKSDGTPAAGWNDADLTQPLHTTPIDHGFDFARFTSRSHGTSGPSVSGRKNKNRGNGPNQNIGPGHIHGRTAVSATGDGKRLVAKGNDAYVLNRLGSRHSDHALQWLDEHVADSQASSRPFFLYYASNSNHSPYTPDKSIGQQSVAGAARTKSGQPMDSRHDYVYENDVALGRLLEWLESNDDPRQVGKKLISNTLVVFTSDNGAEINSDIATGPFRSNKGSCYEGGHRVPFIAAWPQGGIGDGDSRTAGKTFGAPIGHQDLFATLAEIAGVELPDLRAGEKGAEDSYSVLSALKGDSLTDRPPLFFNDHKEQKDDPAVLAMRKDFAEADGQEFPGKWKIFFDASMLRQGIAKPLELYEMDSDPWETQDLRGKPELAALVESLTTIALAHRRVPGHRMVPVASDVREELHFRVTDPLGKQLLGVKRLVHHLEGLDLNLTIQTLRSDEKRFTVSKLGLGIGSEDSMVDDGEGLSFTFDQDVIIESAAIVAGTDGVCGGFYRVGDRSPLAIYCVDADNDAKDQSGILSDIGLLKAGESFTLTSEPHFGTEPPGKWRLQSLSIRLLQHESARNRSAK